MKNEKTIAIIGSSFAAMACINVLLKNPLLKLIIIDDDKDNLKNKHKDTYFKNELIKKNNIINKINFIYKNYNLINPNSKYNKHYLNFNIFNDYIKFNNSNNILFSSKSFGGFSNIWGGVANEPLKEDFENWPIKYNEIESYFNEVKKILSKNFNSKKQKSGNKKGNISKSLSKIYEDLLSKNEYLNNEFISIKKKFFSHRRI